MFKPLCLSALCIIPVCLYAQNPAGMIAPATTQARDTTGEKDLLGILADITHIHVKSPTRERGRKVYYSLLPVSASVPGGGTALVTSTQAAFYLGDRKNTYLSNITFSPSTNFRGQYNFPFRANIWSPGNRWNYQGDVRYSYFPQDTWGLGGGQDYKRKMTINYSYVRFYYSALRRLRPDFYAGIGYNLDYHISIRTDEDTASLQKFTGYPYGTGNHAYSFSSGITFNLLFDGRVNPINPIPGLYYNIVYRVNPKFLGSDDWWHSLYLDVRKYIPFSRRQQNMLGIWSYLWTTFGSKTPYLDLPALGWDTNQRSGRGFANRRYTGNTQWYLETEYRRQLTANGLLGFVVFANMNSVTEPDTRKFAYLHYAAGAGMRVKFNKHSGTNIGIDYGVSKGYGSIYISLGEAF